MFTELISSQIKGKRTDGARITQIRNKVLYAFIENPKRRVYLIYIDIDYKTIQQGGQRTYKCNIERRSKNIVAVAKK
jgi:hypothetical protein